jgi:hypothetical protein
MNGISDDALLGLLLLRKGIDSNNDSEDHCTTQSSNESSMTLPPNDSNATHTSDYSSATPTSSPPKKKRKYKKRGTSFKRKKGSNRAKYTYQVTLKPCVAKTNANVTIAKSLTNAHEDTAAVKICQDDKRKLISLFYL